MNENNSSGILARELGLINVSLDSSLMDLIIDLEHLRRRRYRGSTPAHIFYELKSIFHLLESMGSARLEGNRTALAEMVEENIKADEKPATEKQQEIRNIEAALQYIDSYTVENPITESFIKDVHSLIVKDLTPSPEGEGDRTPGQYREGPVTISDSTLRPPISRALIESHMALLIEFIRMPHPPKYDLLKTALVHHRFTAIHPFANGNGRTVRALTYAMLLQQGFSVADADRILNPTAVFCNDRQEYVGMLALADTGTNDSLEKWCEYVINGLKTEIDKIDNLTDYNYVRKNILRPAIDQALETKSISPEQAEILRLAIRNKAPLMAGDIISVMPGSTVLQRSRMINRMVALSLLQSTAPGKRKYVIAFSNSYLLRGVTNRLRDLDFIPGL